MTHGAGRCHAPARREKLTGRRRRHRPSGSSTWRAPGWIQDRQIENLDEVIERSGILMPKSAAQLIVASGAWPGEETRPRPTSTSDPDPPTMRVIPIRTEARPRATQARAERGIGHDPDQMARPATMMPRRPRPRMPTTTMDTRRRAMTDPTGHMRRPETCTATVAERDLQGLYARVRRSRHAARAVRSEELTRLRAQLDQQLAHLARVDRKAGQSACSAS